MAGFSYAQAAKGRVPAPTTAAPAKPDQVNGQPALENTLNHAPSNVKAPTETPTSPEVAGNESEETSKIDDSTDSASKATTVKSQSISNASGDASPSMTESATTLIKDDEVNGNAKDSESATWEKVSQGSSVDKNTAKSTGESEDSKATGSWEHVPPPQAILKEAPLPTINPWLKRAQDAQKGKPIPAAVGGPSIPSVASDVSQSRKKSRPSVSEASGAKSNDKISKVEEVTTRRYKPSSETRMASRLPPPTSDAISWPTPDSAKPDDKDKDKSPSQDRSETVEQDKERSGGAKKGKKHWEQIEFVPTAVFNTPLPTSRRGGRPSARGGRDNAMGRGAANGGGNDRSSEGDARTPSAEAPADRSRIDATHPRANQNALRQKRLSTSGQAKPRDFRKTDATKSEDVRLNGAELSNNQDLLKTSQAASSNTGISEVGAMPGQQAPFGEQVPTNGIEATNGSSFQDIRSSRPFREPRGDFTGQGRDFSRESNGIPREGRSERGGRGGHRGRGGFNNGNYAHGSHAPNNAYVPGGFGNSKHAYNDRQGQYPAFGSAREGKHFRSGSRSQANGPPSGRNPYFPGMPPYAGAPVPPEMANAYGMPPTMQQPFYHPMMEQVPLIGIIAEQMKYYFSLENLVRDVYLRSRMDDQGFIPLDFMMPWRRMKLMTTDINLVRFACQHVPEIELRLDVNGVDYIRPVQDYNKWILKREERLEEARHEGPNLQPNLPFAHQLPPPPMMYANQAPPMYAPQGFPPKQFRGMNGASFHQDYQGAQSNGHSNGSPNQTPLSATVPEFQPDPSLQGQDQFVDGQTHNTNHTDIKESGAKKPLTNGVKHSASHVVEPAPPETSSGPVVASFSDAE